MWTLFFDQTMFWKWDCIIQEKKCLSQDKCLFWTRIISKVGAYRKIPKLLQWNCTLMFHFSLFVWPCILLPNNDKRTNDFLTWLLHFQDSLKLVITQYSHDQKMVDEYRHSFPLKEQSKPVYFQSKLLLLMNLPVVLLLQKYIVSVKYIFT